MGNWSFFFSSISGFTQWISKSTEKMSILRGWTGEIFFVIDCIFLYHEEDTLIQFHHTTLPIYEYLIHWNISYHYIINLSLISSCFFYLHKNYIPLVNHNTPHSLTSTNTFIVSPLTEVEEASRRVVRVLHLEAVRVMILVVRWDMLTTCASKSTGMEMLCLRAVGRCEGPVRH